MQKSGRLELTWAGKSYETESFEPRLLVEDKEKSYGDDSPNMLIHGDNLLALKALELDYMEAVQCIYIDPPFNTGGRIDASGQEIGYDDGLEHSIWLDMMYVRLKLLRKLLNPTGLIYVHIDDKEQAYLKVIMDEIFGRKNFVQMIAVKRASPAGFKVINPGPLTVTDYILLYAKDKTLMKYIPQRIPVGYDENYNLIINNPNDGPENWSFSKLVDLLYEQYGFKSWKDASNAWGTNWKTVRNSLLGDVALKNADRVVSVRDPHKPSQLIKEKMIESKSNGGKVIEIKRDGMRPIYIFEGGSLSFYKDKLRQIDGELTPTEVLTDFWADINFAGMAKEGAVQFKNSKKPEKLIKRIFLNTVKSDASNGTSNAKAMLKRSCPELSDAHCEDIVASILGAMTMSDSDKVSLVVTAPPSFTIKARTTMNVVQSMINGADRNILITGYSLSSYFSELVDTIIQKSQRGVFVKFFVNDIDKQPSFDKILRYKGRFLKIYNYRQDDDKMAALHAKVISVDQQQTLITSANLSYHGQQGNIELGTLIESKQIAKQIDDIFTKLIFTKDFCEI